MAKKTTKIKPLTDLAVGDKVRFEYDRCEGVVAETLHNIQSDRGPYSRVRVEIKVPGKLVPSQIKDGCIWVQGNKNFRVDVL